MNNYEKTGYLNHNFKIFHLIDHEQNNYDFHYHDFNKIIIFLRGNVTYCIEGKSYILSPYDVILVKAGEVHRPVIHDNTDYERIIIYIAPDYISAYGEEKYDLGSCFEKNSPSHSSVLRMAGMKKSKLFYVMQELRNSFDEKEYAAGLYRDTLFIEFLIHLNRAALLNNLPYMVSSSSNDKIIKVLSHINGHLTEDITIDGLAEQFYTSRYYLMHSFKEQTGYTIGSYLSTKRLLLARDLILNGAGITDACFACGFKNYSTFSRAYKKQFGQPPRELPESF